MSDFAQRAALSIGDHQLSSGIGEEARRLLIVGNTDAASSRAEQVARLAGLGSLRVGHAAAAEAAFASSPADLIVLDPGRSHQVDFTAVRRLGYQALAPLLVVMDHDDEADRYLALELGADDCVSPGCSDRELLARIKAVSRRPTVKPAPAHEGNLRFNGFHLDLVGHELRGPDGRPIKLSPTEYRLLSLFARNAGRVLSPGEISQGCANEGEPLERGNIGVRVYRLRRRLQRAHPGPPVIRCVHGLGYVFDPKVSPHFSES